MLKFSNVCTHVYIACFIRHFLSVYEKKVLNSESISTKQKTTFHLKSLNKKKKKTRKTMQYGVINSSPRLG